MSLYDSQEEVTANEARLLAEKQRQEIIKESIRKAHSSIEYAIKHGNDYALGSVDHPFVLKPLVANLKENGYRVRQFGPSLVRIYWSQPVTAREKFREFKREAFWLFPVSWALFIALTTIVLPALISKC